MSEDFTLSNNDTFISLIRTAQEDNELKGKLLAILRMADIDRAEAVKQWIKESKINGAPAEFITALSFLLDTNIVHEAVRVLSRS